MDTSENKDISMRRVVFLYWRQMEMFKRWFLESGRMADSHTLQPLNRQDRFGIPSLHPVPMNNNLAFSEEFDLSIS